MRLHQGKFSGFTLVEAVIVITITGIISAVVAVFIRGPIQGYFDAARRAEITDVADTAARRFTRDVRLALPNSVRLMSGDQIIEFLPVRLAGRYRADLDSSGGGDPLDFTAADTSFDVLGPQLSMQANDQIVVYNLGIPGADAYEGNSASTHNRRAYDTAGGVGAPVGNITITSANPLPFDSPNHSFYVIDFPVAYKCDLTAGTLTRYFGSNYPINATQADPATIPNVSSALIAKNVTACVFTYTPGATERNGLVTLSLSITQQGETVSLYQQVLINNVP